MAKWHFTCTESDPEMDFDIDINPQVDTGWIPQPVVGEHHPIGALFTIIQRGGRASSLRRIAGVTKKRNIKNKLNQLYRFQYIFTFTDHYDDENSARIKEFEFTELMDASNVPIGTFNYRAVLAGRHTTSSESESDEA
jgi:hypothetical protein